MLFSLFLNHFGCQFYLIPVYTGDPKTIAGTNYVVEFLNKVHQIRLPSIVCIKILIFILSTVLHFDPSGAHMLFTLLRLLLLVY